jgi:hypothetical protein
MDHEGTPMRKRQYNMEFVPDKTLFRAVMFALRMMRKGKPPGVANTRAAQYYGVSVQAVAHYTGQVGGRSAQRKRQR